MTDPNLADDRPGRHRSKLHATLDELQASLDTTLLHLDQRERVERDQRRGADGAVYQRLAGDVLTPARMERRVPMSRLAAAYLPAPARLRSRDWLAEAYETPADAITLSGRTEASLRLVQHAGDQLLLLAALLDTPAGSLKEQCDPRTTRFFSQVWLPALGALDTQTTSSGKEFVPTGMSGRMIERIGAGLTVAELFESVPMPSDPFRIPGFTITRGKAALVAEGTAIRKATPATRELVLDAKKLGVWALVSKELDEDALLPLLGRVEQELAEWIAASIDDAIVNGDTSGTHMDADVTASDDSRKAWLGLRALAPAAAKTDGGNVALTAAMLRTNRKKMGSTYGALPTQLAHVLSSTAASQLASDAGFVSVERYGPHRTPVDGEVGSVDSVPVVVSDYVRQDLNAAGVFDGVTTNRSVAITVNVRSFGLGVRRGVTLQRLEELYAEADQVGCRATMRLAFAPAAPAAAPVVSVTYNLAIS